MHRLRLQNSAQDQAARCQAYHSQMREKIRGKRFFSPSTFLALVSFASEYLFLPNLAKRSAVKLYRWTHDFVGLFFKGFSLYAFSANTFWQQSSLHTHGVRAVSDVTHLFRPSAPHGITAWNDCVFHTLEGLTCWRTSLYLCQCMHFLCLFHLQNVVAC